MKLPNVKVDFQVTGWLSEHSEKTRFGSLGRTILKYVDPHARSSLQDVVKNLYSPDENRAVCLINYYQPKYERIVQKGIQELKQQDFEIDDNNLGIYIGLKMKNAETWLYVVRGIEYMCREGHVLAVATDSKMEPQEYWYTYGPSLEGIIKRDQAANQKGYCKS